MPSRKWNSYRYQDEFNFIEIECIGHVTHERVSINEVIKNQTSTITFALVIDANPINFSSSKDEYPAPHTAEDLVRAFNLF